MNQSANSVDGYTRTQQRLHWIGAVLILAMFPLGFTMARTDNDALRTSLYRAHVIIGVLIAVLVIVRLVLGLRRHVPAPAGLARWNAILFTVTHRVALVVPVLLALSGIAVLIQNDLFEVLQPGNNEHIPSELDNGRPQDAHRVLAWIYLGILATHVLGVVRHQITKGGTLERMGLRLPRSR